MWAEGASNSNDEQQVTFTLTDGSFAVTIDLLLLHCSWKNTYHQRARASLTADSCVAGKEILCI
jgi:hypothetical protein